jgi:hypothetical protein
MISHLLSTLNNLLSGLVNLFSTFDVLLSTFDVYFPTSTFAVISLDQIILTNPLGLKWCQLLVENPLLSDIFITFFK